jgi:polyhydroxybutyrate depolymerase
MFARRPAVADDGGMRMLLRVLAFLCVIAPFAVASAQTPQRERGRERRAERPAARLDERTWKVTHADGAHDREALLWAPPKSSIPSTGAPLVFVFHGRGGNPRNVARGFALHEHWPEAIVVYPAGLPTPGRLTDPDGKLPGWQPAAGTEGDRDLAFFDTMYASLTEEFSIDRDRVYVTGHSNGGGFTYVLWQSRHDRLAAVAPSAAGGRSARSLKPLPAFHLAGEEDTVVRYDGQVRTVEAIREANGCTAPSSPWKPVEAKGLPERELALTTVYPSPGGTPVVTYIHPGGHEFKSSAVPLIVAFFREHRRPTAPSASATDRTGKGDEGQIAPIRAFYIGHSLHSDIPDIVSRLGDGSPLFSFREQFIPGAPLRWQWEERDRDPAKRAMVEPQFQGRWFEAFPKGDLTALVLVDSVPRGPEAMGGTREYAGRLIVEFAKSNPKGIIYINEPWHCLKSGTPDGCAYDTTSPTRTLPWRERLIADAAMWDELVEALRKDHPSVRIELIPSGRALAALDSTVSSGGLDGFTRIEELFDDEIHPNPYAKYFIACVHYAILTGKSPEGSMRMVKDRWGRSYWDTPNWQGKQWKPPSAKAIAQMQATAWSVVEAQSARRTKPQSKN